MTPLRKTNRRQFLQGESAVDAITDLSQGTHSSDAPAATGRARSRDDLLMQVGRPAMACTFQIVLKNDQQPGSVEAAMEALNAVDQLEAQLTVYRGESEISEINRRASHEACPVEPRLFELLCRCTALSNATSGAFDITAGPLVKLWGFHTRQGRFPSDQDIQETLRRVGSRHLHFDQKQHTIRFGCDGLELNLGSVGKGYALDRCAKILEESAVSEFMIHGGHSSILARGARTRESEVPGWRVDLRHPLRPDRRLAEICLDNQSLGTSGSGQQFFYHQGRRYGHVLDPRSGTPSEGVLSATVLAPSAEDADALATAFFVMGVEPARSYCADQPDVSVIFVLPGARQGTVAIETVGVSDRVLISEP